MSEEEKNVYKSLFEYPIKIIAGLEKENQQLKVQIKQKDEVIDETIEDINLVIELIKQQPTDDDSWILQRLNSFKIVLKKVKGKK